MVFKEKKKSRLTARSYFLFFNWRTALHFLKERPTSEFKKQVFIHALLIAALGVGKYGL